MQVAKEAALCALREAFVATADLASMDTASIPPLGRDHLLSALRCVRPSVSTSIVSQYEEWHARYGTQASSSALTHGWVQKVTMKESSDKRDASAAPVPQAVLGLSEPS